MLAPLSVHGAKHSVIDPPKQLQMSFFRNFGPLFEKKNFLAQNSFSDFFIILQKLLKVACKYYRSI